MDVFTRFKETLLEFGLEAFGKYYGIYEGFVNDNKDPEFMGRLLLEVPKVYGQEISDEWAFSKGMYAGLNAGFFAIPAIGDAVWVSFKNGDPRYPIWEYGWFGKDDVPEVARREDPTNAVFQYGSHILEFDAENNRVRLSNKAGFVIEMNEAGIHLGKNDKGDEPAVLGDTLQKLLEDFFDAILNAKTMTLMGLQPLVNLPEFQALKERVAEIKSKKITLIK